MEPVEITEVRGVTVSKGLGSRPQVRDGLSQRGGLFLAFPSQIGVDLRIAPASPDVRLRRRAGGELMANGSRPFAGDRDEEKASFQLRHQPPIFNEMAIWDSLAQVISMFEDALPVRRQTKVF